MRTSTRCPDCGADVRDGSARWCGSCGAPIATVAPQDDVRDRQRDATPAGGHEVTGRDPGRWGVIAVVVVVLAGLLGLQALRRPPSPPLGHTDRGDSARTGQVAADDVAAPRAVEWSVPVELPLPVTRPAAVGLGADEVVVLGEAGLTVHERADGAVRWHRSAPRPATEVDGPDPAPVVAGDVVVTPSRVGAGSEATEVRAYDRRTGRERWSSGWREVTGLHVVDGAVLIIDLERVLTLVDADTGRVRWQIDTLRRLDMAARAVLSAAADGPLLLYLTSPAGVDPFRQAPDVVGEYAVAFDPADGQPSWGVDLPRDTLSPLPFAVVGDELVGLGPERLHRWDRRTGAPLGEVPHGGAGLAAALVGAGTAVLVDRPAEGIVGRYEPDGDGTPAWTAELRSSRTGHRVVAAGDVVHVPTTDGIEVRSLATGERITTHLGDTEHVSVSASDGGQAAAWADGEIGVLDPDGALAWHAATMLPPVPAPSVRDGIYVSTAAAVTAFEPGGDLRWTVPMSSDTRPARPDTAQPVAVHEEAVLVVPPLPRDGPARGLVALDPQRGVPRWDRSGDSPSATGPLTLSGDLVFVPVADQIHGYDVLTGRRAFAALAHAPRGPVAASAERVVAATPADVEVADGAPGLVAIHRSDRRTAWRRPAEVCSAPVVAGGHVLVVGPSTLRAYLEDTGTQDVAVGLTDSGCHPPAVADGMAVVAEDARTLMGVRIDGGVITWRADLAAPLVAPPTIAGRTVLVPTLDAVTGLDLDDGAPRWRMPLDAAPASSIAVVDGAPLLLTRDGRLVRLDG